MSAVTAGMAATTAATAMTATAAVTACDRTRREGGDAKEHGQRHSQESSHWFIPPQFALALA
jgi:hypothetical protein